jgi:protein ImuB
MPEEGGPRIACMRVPLFPLAARLRSEPELKGEAVAVFEGNGNAARIVAATLRARKAGVRRGMTLAQARGLLPRLGVRARDAECERAAQESLLEAAESFSPRVEDAGEGLLYLDLDGLERRFSKDGGGIDTAGGNDDAEHRLGGALIAAAEALTLPARVGIAGSKLAARVATESPESPVVVPRGDEAPYLAPLPLSRLASEAGVVAALQRWGIRSIGDFARLPANEVASRLGSEGQQLHERARGLDRRPIIPRHPPPSFQEGLELDWPLVSLEPFLFVAHAALDRLCRRLEASGLGCARLDFALRLEPSGHDERSITLPAPTRETKTLLTLVKLDLERRAPGAPVSGFTFAAHPDRPREAQLTLFGPTALSPDRLATTLARLFSLLGVDGVGSPRVVDGHRPERSTLAAYTPPPPPEVRPQPARRNGAGLLAVRVLRPPVALEVLLGDRRQPTSVSAEPAASSDSSEKKRGSTSIAGPTIAGRVQVASGPWRVEEGWWTEEAVDRDYWDVELSDGGVYRIFRDRGTEAWWADGIYD